MVKKTMILIAERHQEWIYMAKSLGLKQVIAEDIVQEMYIKIQLKLEKGLDITYEDDINTFYIYKTLKSLFIDLKRKGKNITIYSMDEVRPENNEKRINIQSYTTDINYDEAYEKIQKELSGMYWYDRKVFELYYYEGNTLDSLAKKTGISRNSLFTTIDKVREILKKELADE